MQWTGASDDDVFEINLHYCGLYSFCFEQVSACQGKNSTRSVGTVGPLCIGCLRVALDVYGTQQCVVSDNNLVVTSRCVCVCVCVCFLPIHSGHPSSLDVPAGVTNTGGRSHRISHPLSFCGACLSFFSREGFSHSFPSSTVKSNFVY